MRIIGIKLGSQLLANGRGELDFRLVTSVCAQLAELKQAGERVFVVTSGAVACDSCRHRSKNLRAAIGQTKLMEVYKTSLIFHGLEVAQFLPTYQDLQTEDGVFFHTIMEALDDPRTIPVINYNDPMDHKELEALHRFADNDRLFQRVCELVKAETAIIAFTSPALINADGKYIRVFKACESARHQLRLEGGSELGHGQNGMQTKHAVLCELSKTVPQVVLAPGREPHFIFRVLDREKNFGTIYLP